MAAEAFDLAAYLGRIGLTQDDVAPASHAALAKARTKTRPPAAREEMLMRRRESSWSITRASEGDPGPARGVQMPPPPSLSQAAGRDGAPAAVDRRAPSGPRAVPRCTCR